MADERQLGEISDAIGGEVERLNELLDELKGSDTEDASLAEIERVVEGLRTNLGGLDGLVRDRLGEAVLKDERLRTLSAVRVQAERLLTPQILLLDARVEQLRRLLAGGSIDAERRNSATRDLANAILSLQPLQKATVEMSSAYDELLRAATEENPANLPLRAFPLRRSLTNLQALPNSLEARHRGVLALQLEALRGLVEGDDAIPAIRARELGLTEKSNKLLAENRALTQRLRTAVDGLVATADDDIGEASDEAERVQEFATAVLLAAIVLSLVSSILIVWLYVGRNITRRLTDLSASMLAIANGNLQTRIPHGGGDEIGKMSQALVVFRDTAIEVEQASQRQISGARRRLTDAIESVSEGFSLYDADDRLLVCNSRYSEIYPSIADLMVPGTPFESILRRSAARNLVDRDKQSADEWVAARLAAHRNPRGPIEQRMNEGRWVRINERKVEGGGTVAVYSDITELKRREEELAAANSALRLSEQRYALAMEGAKEGLWDWRTDTGEAYVSPQFKAIAGLENDRAANHSRRLGYTDSSGRRSHSSRRVARAYAR